MRCTDPDVLQITYLLAYIEGKAFKEQKQLPVSRCAARNISNKITRNN